MKPLPAPAVDKQQVDAQIPAAAGQDTQRRQIRSDELFDGSRAVQIEHSGEVYTLRKTSKGKLILTK